MKRRWISVERARSIGRDALLYGYGELIPYTVGTGPWSVGSQEFGPDGLPRFQRAVRLRLNMDCEDPYPFELVARWSSFARKPLDIMAIFGLARCRKCDRCRERRSLFWAGRAMSEFKASPRTLLGTFTLSPEKHQEFDWRLDVGEAGVRPAVDIYSLTEAGRFQARASIIGDEITKWLKSVRKGQGMPLAGGHWHPKLRYLLIAEAHDSEATSDVMRGRPHFHILLHEQKAGALVIGDLHQALTRGRSYEWEKRRIKERGQWVDSLWATNDSWIKRLWKHGHSSFRLCVDANSAVYPCKYLTKSLRLRVRASQGYGGTGGQGTPRVEGPPPRSGEPTTLRKQETTTPPPNGGRGSGGNSREVSPGRAYRRGPYKTKDVSEASYYAGEVD